MNLWGSISSLVKRIVSKCHQCSVQPGNRDVAAVTTAATSRLRVLKRRRFEIRLSWPSPDGGSGVEGDFSVLTGTSQASFVFGGETVKWQRPACKRRTASHAEATSAHALGLSARTRFCTAAYAFQQPLRYEAKKGGICDRPGKNIAVK